MVQVGQDGISHGGPWARRKGLCSLGEHAKEGGLVLEVLPFRELLDAKDKTVRLHVQPIGEAALDGRVGKGPEQGAEEEADGESLLFPRYEQTYQALKESNGLFERAGWIPGHAIKAEDEGEDDLAVLLHVGGQGRAEFHQVAAQSLAEGLHALLGNELGAPELVPELGSQTLEAKEG